MPSLRGRARKCKRIIKDYLSYRSVFLRELIVRNDYKRRYRKYEHNYPYDTEPKTVLFISYWGRSYSCSPKAVYEYMLAHPAYDDYRFIWVFRKLEEHQYLLENPRTTIVAYDTRQYYAALRRAKYWFINNRINKFVWPKEDQILVQCWHGTPLKRLTNDFEGGVNARRSSEYMSVQYINEGKKLKYFVSPSAYASEKFISAFRLRDANKADAMLETGYPRNDLLFNYDEAMIAGIREKLGIDPDDQRKIILYAPTWRDDQYDPVTGYTYNLNVDFDQMKADMDDEYIIIFRVHYFISNSFDFERFGDFIIDASEYDDINHLYIVSDLLITDYSSVFFDYANLKRPMLFYMYDLAFYEEKARGFYFDIREELPGQIVEREEALIPAIRTALSSFVYNDQYKAFNAKYNYLDDGEATKRLLDIVCHPLDSAY